MTVNGEEKSFHRHINTGLGSLIVVLLGIMATWINGRFNDDAQRIAALEARMVTTERTAISRPEMEKYVGDSGPYIQDRQLILQNLKEIKKISDINESLIRLSITMDSLGKTVEALNNKLNSKVRPPDE